MYKIEPTIRFDHGYEAYTSLFDNEDEAVVAAKALAEKHGKAVVVLKQIWKYKPVIVEEKID